MALIAGTYQYEQSENMEVFLAKLGIPQDLIVKSQQDKSNVQVTYDGSTINMKTDTIAFSFHVNKEYPEKLLDIDVTTKTVLDGNTFTVTRTFSDGLTETKVFTFSDTHVVCIYGGTKVGNIKAKRIYKRI